MKLKTTTVKALIALVQMQKNYCRHCPIICKTRCCHHIYCGVTERIAKEILKVSIPEPLNNDVKYLSESGCVIPVELRPFCSQFFCQASILLDEDVKMDRKLRNIINKDPAIIAIFKSRIVKDSPTIRTSTLDDKCEVVLLDWKGEPL